MKPKGLAPASDSKGVPAVQRRALLQGAAALACGAAAPAVVPGALSAPIPDSRSAAPLIARDGDAIATTRAGRVAGYIRRGILTFKGIPYADNTAGANRFMPPAKPKSWEGVRSSRQYGYVAPQGPRAGWANDEEAFMFAWDDGVQNEDCLRLNVWTPAVADHKKRAVMVWLHGGGYTAGSGQELRSYDGENTARRGDVVVVSLNHRLNVLGYLDLSKFGEQYASSGNAGMLDIVAALEWVRDNIENFGGNPQMVTIFGQSGGGAKVSTLMAMPAAKGLFHRAIVQSGSVLQGVPRENAQKVADAIVGELGLTAATLAQIQTLPYQQLLTAADKVLRERLPKDADRIPIFRRIAYVPGFAPVVDGKILPQHPFDPGAPALSADIPMIIGTTLNEFVTAINHPESEAMSEAELQTRVRAIHDDKTMSIIRAFRERTPRAKPFDIWSRIAASGVRGSAILQAKLKAEQGRAPAYLYWFTWQTPILSGRPRAFHCAEIAFVFDNTERCETMTGGGAEARTLAGKMCDAWIQFAKTGNPNHRTLPHWPAFSAETIPTMILDSPPRVEMNPDGAEQKSVGNG
ncbi:MAG TPA: carboxylesterase/lipase family protein [Steroidobacteraceae bacterium]